MNVKVKTTLIIIMTLVLGIALGAMLNRALVHRRIARAFSLRNPATIPTMIERVLSPDPEQRKKLRSILDQHANNLLEIREDFENRMMAANADLQSELEPLLTPEQKIRLREGPLMPKEFFRREGRRPRLPRRGPRGAEDVPWSARPRPGRVGELDTLNKRLALSDEQMARIRAILMRQRFPMSMNIEVRNLERMIQWWKRRERNRYEAISAVLTDEQKNQYAQIIEEQKQRLHDFLLN
jgi:hypothetical protein